MDILQVMGVFIITLTIILFMPVKANAHCDTMDGPTAIDGRKALETNNINYALKWITSDYEDELRRIFEKCVKVRALSPEAQELADMYFLENLVRIHRAGEGAPFEGLKPSGTPIDKKVAAADKSVEIGNLSPLEGLVSPEEMHELKGRFEKVMSLKNFDVNDVEAGRKYIEAYVSFFKTAEGEEHEHGSRHSHGHGH
ncbi:LysM domain protein (plasmid) [Peptoclostridium acidaminophilum DSM 3953]|uniref:LysM domain protein n=1 Tax=Peptoclostridium acidaminophilum DSM 3953 TaxID=1286171 RepID=W8TIN0_PEPAC|nr:DUF6448 family protein [Peptoclostridium acidaminophilum]AHM57638.1 LysM domain protein [Peptoclostridium acidaminophilum DSM 3953]